MGSRNIVAAAILVFLGYCLLVNQRSDTFNFQEPQSVQVPDFIKALPISNYYDDENVTLDDIFISVKTSKRYHDSRLPVIVDSWFELAKDQTWFFTDTDSEVLQLLTNGHMVNTNCSDSGVHNDAELCCKTSVEYDTYLKSGRKWFCHFDDDNYVNVPRLVSILQQYNSQKDWYLGRRSTDRPFSINKKEFWFATFGAGVCISRSLALKIMPVASEGKFMGICEDLNFPDDVAMGYLAEIITNTRMVIVPEFHSHYDHMKTIPQETFRDQISFSYNLKNNADTNVVNVSGFNETYDPTRFLSLHCFLHPHSKSCLR